MNLSQSRVASFASVVLCLVANAASSGEITGNGKWIAGDPDAPLSGKSECAFSGREDDPNDTFFRGDIAQSWGQILKAVRDALPAYLHPGVSCNPQRSQGE